MSRKICFHVSAVPGRGRCAHAEPGIVPEISARLSRISLLSPAAVIYTGQLWKRFHVSLLRELNDMSPTYACNHSFVRIA